MHRITIRCSWQQHMRFADHHAPTRDVPTRFPRGTSDTLRPLLDPGADNSATTRK